jgi:hypothetical protein
VRAFATKVDGGVVFVLAAGILIGTSSAAAALSAAPLAGVLGLGVVVAVLAVVGIVSYPTAYELHPKALVIRTGILSYEIAYDSIVAVRPTRSPVSAPAWSLDRLRIEYQGGVVLVSPKEREQFLSELALRTWRLRRKGDRLSIAPEGVL